ncbi:MAG TPA: hypothetical protein VN944_09030, partial [Nitrospiria bacterium]|nr:hypothetical protein [Nitrospiria bacterium]
MNFSRVALLILVCFFLFPEKVPALQVNDSLRMDGFILQGFLITDHHQYQSTSPNGSFNFNSFDLVLKAEVNDRFRIWSKLYSSNEITDVITLEWAFGEYYFNDLAMLRMGKMKMPVGIYNEIRHVYPVLPIIFEPMFYDEPNRFVPVHFKGVSLTGSNEAGPSHISYDLFAGSTGGDYDAPANSGVDDLFGARLWMSPEFLNLKIGFS